MLAQESGRSRGGPSRRPGAPACAGAHTPPDRRRTIAIGGSDMGEMVSFKANGREAQGYLAVPSRGDGPGIVVIQEYWGLVPQIKGTCDAFAREGFVALAPDLYHGKTTSSPDEAGKMMMALRIDEAE